MGSVNLPTPLDIEGPMNWSALGKTEFVVEKFSKIYLFYLSLADYTNLFIRINKPTILFNTLINFPNIRLYFNLN